jgi:hypothetical protein
VARFRRELLERPGFTRRPVCGAWQREVLPRDFGREFCKACEPERGEVSAYWQAQIDATLANEPSATAEPMFGGAAAERPFLAEDED